MQLDTGAVLGAFASLAVLIGPLAILVTKLTDFVRNLIDPKAVMPKVVWSVVPLVIGVVVCLLWQFNVMGAFVQLIPAFKDSDAMTGAWGQVLTGLAAGATAGGWHDKFAKSSAIARAENTAAMSGSGYRANVS